MARGRSRKQRNPTKRNRRQRNRQSRGILPPAQSIHAAIYCVMLQCTWDIASGSKAYDRDYLVIDCGYILSYSWGQLKTVFNEMKVHKIVAHYMPDSSIVDRGIYLFGFSDDGENVIPSFAEETKSSEIFNKLVGSPGTVVRKIGQPSKLTWYPTEPDDRNWVLTNGFHKYCDLFLVASEKEYWFPGPEPSPQTTTDELSANIDGKYIVEVHASFRGRYLATAASTSNCCGKCRFQEEMRRLDRIEQRLDAMDRGASPSSEIEELG